MYVYILLSVFDHFKKTLVHVWILRRYVWKKMLCSLHAGALSAVILSNIHTHTNAFELHLHSRNPWIPHRTELKFFIKTIADFYIFQKLQSLWWSLFLQYGLYSLYSSHFSPLTIIIYGFFFKIVIKFSVNLRYWVLWFCSFLMFAPTTNSPHFPSFFPSFLTSLHPSIIDLPAYALARSLPFYWASDWPYDSTGEFLGHNFGSQARLEINSVNVVAAVWE